MRGAHKPWWLHGEAWKQVKGEDEEEEDDEVVDEDEDDKGGG